MSISDVTTTFGKVASILLGEVASDEIEVGNQVVVTPPSGIEFEGVVLELDFFCGQAHAFIRYSFVDWENPARMIVSTGWYLISDMRKGAQ